MTQATEEHDIIGSIAVGKETVNMRRMADAGLTTSWRVAIANREWVKYYAEYLRALHGRHVNQAVVINAAIEVLAVLVEGRPIKQKKGIAKKKPGPKKKVKKNG
jgi:hypothetical protein